MASRKKTRRPKGRRPRGSGGVRERGGKYIATVYLPGRTAAGKRPEKSATCDTAKEAEAALFEMRSAITNGSLVATDKLTVNDLIDRYLVVKKETNEATTWDWYERHFRTHVRGVIGTLRVADLTTGHVRALVTNAKNQSRTLKRGEPLNGKSKRNLLVAIRAALAWGMDEDPPLVAKNVAEKVKLGKLKEVERDGVALDDVLVILATARGGDLEHVVPFQILTGLRRAETCGLQWGDIDLDAGTISVKRNAVNLRGKVIIKATKTETSNRTENLAPSAVAVLRQRKAAQATRHVALGIGNRGKAGLVFDRFDGKPWDPNEMSRLFTRMRQKHNLPNIRLHDLRHGNASFQHAAGVSLKDISASLGHASIAITSKTYVHRLDPGKRARADALETYLAPPSTPIAKGRRAGRSWSS